MTAPVTRFTIATPVPSATRTGGYDMAYTDVVLASDYERLDQECEKLRTLLRAVMCEVGPFELGTDLCDRIDAALQAKP